MFTPLFIGADPHCCTAPVKAIVWLWSRHCAAKELKTILRGRGGTFICFHFLSKWSLRDESLTPVRGLWSGWKMGKVNFFPLKYWKNIRIHNFGSDHFYPILTFLLIFFQAYIRRRALFSYIFCIRVLLSLYIHSSASLAICCLSSAPWCVPMLLLLCQTCLESQWKW